MADNTGTGPSYLSWTSVVKSIANIPTAIYSVGQIVAKIFPQSTNATVTSATGGSATALPAQPAGYLVVTLANGTTAKFPFYN